MFYTCICSLYRYYLKRYPLQYESCSFFNCRADTNGCFDYLHTEWHGMTEIFKGLPQEKIRWYSVTVIPHFIFYDESDYHSLYQNMMDFSMPLMKSWVSLYPASYNFLQPKALIGFVNLFFLQVPQISDYPPASHVHGEFAASYSALCCPFRRDKSCQYADAAVSAIRYRKTIVSKLKRNQFTLLLFAQKISDLFCFEPCQQFFDICFILRKCGICFRRQLTSGNETLQHIIVPSRRFQMHADSPDLFFVQRDFFFHDQHSFQSILHYKSTGAPAFISLITHFSIYLPVFFSHHVL